MYPAATFVTGGEVERRRTPGGVWLVEGPHPPGGSMVHGNARLTFHGWLLIFERRQEGWKQAHIAAAMGISRKCVKTWLDRYANEGEAGLHDRSSRPHTTPTRTPPSIEHAVVEMRRRERRGPEWIGPELGLAPRTVTRILRR